MTFNEFIERETRQDDANQTRPNEEGLRKWLARVSELHDMVKDIMSDYVKSGKVNIKTEDVELYEELLGRYKVPQMTITFGDFGKFITLKPVGTYVIGAWGRVDMIGQNGGVIRLVLVDSRLKSPRVRVTISVADEPVPQKVKTPQNQEEPELVWRLATMPPKIEYIPITEKTFFEAVMELFGYE